MKDTDVASLKRCFWDSDSRLLRTYFGRRNYLIFVICEYITMIVGALLAAYAINNGSVVTFYIAVAGICSSYVLGAYVYRQVIPKRSKPVDGPVGGLIV